MAYQIKSVEGNQRMSTQELLQEIYAGMEQGENEFVIDGCGQHNIGGPLWNEQGTVRFSVTNPGQRVGSMALEGTTVVVEGSASADTGWLNAGGEIIVKGDSGDTTAHCAAAGNIYIGGRVGTRSGSLMKHDPAYDAPQFWVLKNTGSFSFEFMGGGTAVVCGVDSEEFDSVLGDRACAGMVGGTVYFRGNAEGIATATTKILDLDEQDIAFLKAGLPDFLKKIDREECLAEVTDFSQWKKVAAKTYEERAQKSAKKPMNAFRANDWIKGGIFGDIYEDDHSVVSMVNRGSDRLRIPEWLNAAFMAPCEAGCPAGIPSQTRFNLLREGRYEDAYKLVLEYTPFPGSVCGAVCPNLCMQECTRCAVDSAANIKGLGRQSTSVSMDLPAESSGRKVAIVGAGVGGLTTAWMLRLRGHEVTVFDKDEVIGGKLVNAVSRERLETATIEAEIERIEKAGIEFVTNTTVDVAKYEELKKSYDYVVLAIGAYSPKLPPWPGKERIASYLDFLKQVNAGQRPEVGDKVVVIGCGNSGMDVIFGAYACGAKEVTALDVQQPAAFQDEIDHAEKLGAKLIWPAFTSEITEDGVKLNDGTVLEADTVFCCIGEAPKLDGILPEAETDRGYLKTGDGCKLEENVYAIGDLTKLGLLVEAIGAGREVALRINAELNGETFAVRPRINIPKERLSLDYFSAVDTTDYMERPQEDHNRCISCGTCRDCEMCLHSCPEKAITRRVNDDGTFEYVSDDDLCIGCGICQGVCPCGIWTMADAPTPEA
ncbi:FAD-dependent oxidoreductase [Tichowtungia aerotolerans]|uniref:FAD-dependent oxidoreductase n=1 Tax=Tichowtungia aerotolerans TaxID=2697043 RepID=A0A6P1M6A1_9BACT|nr:FAD-dependent oxidoreductase [Tichowtungia aerotolerans]QHI69387.1 FAD-dependent oxidoreductase [Tichowtungia aerotolerans]